MTRDEIKRLAEQKRFDEYPGPSTCWAIVDFAIAIHDAAKEEDAEIVDALPLGASQGAIMARIRASKVNK